MLKMLMDHPNSSAQPDQPAGHSIRRCARPLPVIRRLHRVPALTSSTHSGRRRRRLRRLQCLPPE
ncbi:hypothetical protein GBAR_LOCUS10801, partial [Geodia barretti]